MTRASDEMSTGPPSRSTKPRVVDVRSRIVATTTKATSAPEKRALTSKVDPIRPKSVVKVVSTSPSGSARVNAGPARRAPWSAIRLDRKAAWNQLRTAMR